MRTIFGALIILVIISAALPGAVYAQEQSCAEEYTILAGDTLSKLASKYLGAYSAYPAIVAATNARRAQDDSFAEIINPDSVEVGWKLCIPPDENAAADVTVAVTSTAAAAPHSTGLAGKIVLQAASGGAIYTVNADGSDLRYLTDGLDPAWSPDGSQIAFTKWGHDMGVYVIDADGQNERCLQHLNVKLPKSPRWSPDGDEIVFSRYDGGAMENYDMTIERAITDRRTGEVIMMMTFVRENLPPDAHWLLRVINAWDGEYYDLSTDKYAYAPDWSPDGSKIVYDGRIGLGMTIPEPVVVDGAYYWEFTAHQSDAMPVWAPDGSKIAFNFWQHDHWEVYTMNADGSGLARLTKNDILGDAPDNVAPTWSPDGAQIAFLTNRAGGGEWEIYVMDADGSDQRPMFPDGLGVNIYYDYANERVLDWAE